MWNEIKRKIFHLMGIGYVVGVVCFPRRLYLLGLLVMVVALFFLERYRLSRPGVTNWLQSRSGGLFRPEEESRFSGVFWMTLGVLLTVAISSNPAFSITALLYLLLGDAVASLVGKRIGGRRWPGSDKSLAGSAACFLMCLISGFVILRPEHAWHGVVIGALVATFVEKGFWRLNDNITIPVVSVLALILSYGNI